jgi:DNA-binding CsgD family transcriptional regulator
VLSDARAGRSRVMVLRGEAGAGKSALLAYVTDQAAGWSIATAVGVESEMELAFSGLHQLCAPLLDNLDQLPTPQRDALGTVFGLTAGPAPDRFLVALATLTLLATTAERQPLACIIDDAQWLDDASAQTLAFVARRLLAEPIALVFAVRTGAADHILEGLPDLVLHGLGDSDARELLLTHVHGAMDIAVCDQIVAESHGNPLALLELPRTWNTADLAGGFGLPAGPVLGKIEASYATRLLRLPEDTQLLTLVAAAEPIGDPFLLRRAAGLLGLDMAAALPATDAGLLQIGARVEFAHPLVRSAAYRSAPTHERLRVHAALADATDGEADPDRRAWHRSRATAAPDEDVALELEGSAGRAEARGGLAAAAAFLERAATLSPDPARRAHRELGAANAKQLAGAPHAAAALLASAVKGPLDERDDALAHRLEGQIAIDLRRIGESGPILLEAARRLESIDPVLARDTYLEAIRAGRVAGRLGNDMLRRAAVAARSAPPPSGDPRAADLLLEGLAVRFTEGYAASAPLHQRALRAFRDEDGRAEQDVRWPGFARAVALDLFDDDSCHALCTRSVQLARERGALGVLPLALEYLATIRALEGDLDAAKAYVEEADEITAATGTIPFGMGKFALAGLRGDRAAVAAIVSAVEPLATARGEGGLLTKAEYATATLHNGLGHYEEALAAAEAASARDGETFAAQAMSEYIEAAARCGRTEAATAAVERLTERTTVAGTEWALGLQARARALVSDGPAAEELYREAIDRLGRCRIGTDHARAHLLYGEWLRRSGRRVDARERLGSAHEMFLAYGMEAFADRTRRELVATGAVVRKRTAAARDDLTAQEAQIAELAREGQTNTEIASQLFLSTRTVEWHMRKVLTKLGISSRRELDAALGTPARAPQSV